MLAAMASIASMALPLGKNRTAIFDGGAMRSSDNAAAMSGTLQIHSAPARK